MTANATPTRCPICLALIFDPLPDTATCGAWKCRDALVPRPVSPDAAPRIGAAVCGVDCHPGDSLCNNYCRDSRVKLPPPIALPVASVTTDDVRAVAKFLDQKLTAAREGKRGVMLSWEDAQGFALTLHAAADALALSPSGARAPSDVKDVWGTY